MNKIAKLSNKIDFFAAALFYALPLLSAYLWFNLNSLPQGILDHLLPFNATLVDSVSNITVPLSISNSHYVINSSMTKVIGFCLSLLPLSIVMLALSKIRKLLKHYANGDIFTLENALIYRGLALLLFASCLVDMIYVPLASVGLTFSNPEGYRVLIASFGTPQIETLFVASLVLLISWVMREGFTMAEEQAGTV